MLREQGKHKEPMRSRNQFNLSSLSDFCFFTAATVGMFLA